MIGILKIGLPVRLEPRSMGLLLIGFVSLGAFWEPLLTLVRRALESEQYSHVVIIPLAAGYLPQNCNFFHFRPVN